MVDEKSRIKRLMSTFGIQNDKNHNMDQASVENRVSQWLNENESNFKKFDHVEENLDLKFWEKTWKFYLWCRSEMKSSDKLKNVEKKFHLLIIRSDKI